MEVVLAGRTAGTLAQCAAELWEEARCSPHARPVWVTTDVRDPAVFADTLDAVRPTVVVHTAGPFQALGGDGDRYIVARACVRHGCHYVDMCDDRSFVEGFADSLDAAATEAGVTLITGASTTPGLTSAVVQRFREAWPAGELHNVQM